MKLSEKIEACDAWWTADWADEARKLEERVAVLGEELHNYIKAERDANARVAELAECVTNLTEDVAEERSGARRNYALFGEANARVAELEEMLSDEDEFHEMLMKRANARAEAAEAKLARVRAEARVASQWDDAGKDSFNREHLPARILAILNDEGSDHG